MGSVGCNFAHLLCAPRNPSLLPGISFFLLQKTVKRLAKTNFWRFAFQSAQSFFRSALPFFRSAMPAIPFYLHVTLSDTRWKSFRRIFLVRLESCRGETICLDAASFFVWRSRRFGDQSDSQTSAA